MILKNKPYFFFAIIAAAILLASSTSLTPPPDKAKSLEAFDTVLQVLKSPRCMNCHPSDDFPRQGDDRHIHVFNVTRGTDDHGGPVQKCETCHREENNEYSNIPGAPHWGLAPKSMGWQGLSDTALAQALLDRSKNGNRSAEDLVRHMSEGALVLWAWNPGGQRTPPPIPLDEFKQALQDWLENGAQIPSE